MPRARIHSLQLPTEDTLPSARWSSIRVFLLDQGCLNAFLASVKHHLVSYEQPSAKAEHHQTLCTLHGAR